MFCLKRVTKIVDRQIDKKKKKKINHNHTVYTHRFDLETTCDVRSKVFFFFSVSLFVFF